MPKLSFEIQFFSKNDRRPDSQKVASQVCEPGAEKLLQQAKTLFTDLLHKVPPLLSKHQDEPAKEIINRKKNNAIS